MSLSESEWIPVLTKEFGFDVHHAKPPSQIVMMKWISEAENCQVSKFFIYICQKLLNPLDSWHQY